MCGNLDMKAMLFAAGRGTRLQPLTSQLPKCLVKAGNKTLLEHNIMLLKKAGVDSLVINVHHLAQQVIDFVDAHDFEMDIQISVEEELLETGGGLLFAANHFRGEEAFFVSNSDIYTNLDLGALLANHLDKKSLATIAVADRETSRYLRFNSKRLLCGWENRRTKEEISWNNDSFQTHAFNGIQVLSPKIFDYMKDFDRSFSTIPVYLKAAKAGARITAYTMDDAYWIDIGTPEKLEELRLHLSKTKGDD